MILFADDEAYAESLDRYFAGISTRGAADYYLPDRNVFYWVGDGAQNDSRVHEGRAVLEDCFTE